jgi:hypothetical protein
MATLSWPTVDELRRSVLYSEELGIDLARGDAEEDFKWFLASLLFGGRITETIARNTYRACERHGLLTPGAILDAGWDFLVSRVMREGGYVRYDGRKSQQILRDCRQLVDEYCGSVREIDRVATNPRDLERRLLAFYGVGPVTVNIFLRELRPFWRHADPEPLPAVLEAAAACGVDLGTTPRRSLVFARIEAGLVRARHQRRGPTPARA